MSISWDELVEPEKERICNTVLFQGGTLYPELQLPIPIRAISDPACPYCCGSGRAPNSETIENLICYCGGLGWIPRQSDQA
jgi:hypothetical protein